MYSNICGWQCNRKVNNPIIYTKEIRRREGRGEGRRGGEGIGGKGRGWEGRGGEGRETTMLESQQRLIGLYLKTEILQVGYLIL